MFIPHGDIVDVITVSASLAHTKLTQLRTQDSDSLVHTKLTQLYTHSLGPWGGGVGLVNFIIGTQPLLVNFIIGTQPLLHFLRPTITLQPWGVGWG